MTPWHSPLANMILTATSDVFEQRHTNSGDCGFYHIGCSGPLEIDVDRARLVCTDCEAEWQLVLNPFTPVSAEQLEDEAFDRSERKRQMEDHYPTGMAP